MQITSNTFTDGERIPGRCAFCVPHPVTHVERSDNLNPHIAWTDLPKGTRSVAIICHDYDVPTKPDDVNQEGRTVPASLPRTDFFHWVLINVDPALGEIAEGAASSGVTERGKAADAAPHGRHGINDYTQWFTGDPDMDGNYHGYDGPCPPWNDEIMHHYRFSVYALDTGHLNVEAPFDGPTVQKAMQGHILDEASITGTYTLNPALAY